MGHSVLPKSANESRIKENIDIFDWSIPEDLMAKFSEIKQACPNVTFFFLLVAFHGLCLRTTAVHVPEQYAYFNLMHQSFLVEMQ